MKNKEVIESASSDVYTFDDGKFAFWAARVNGHDIVFRVRSDTKPAERAAQKGVPLGSSIFRASKDQIKEWLLGHPEYVVRN